MADQKKITLRQGHATPKNIILNELPVATPSAGTTIYLYEGHATAKNIILRDPTVLVSQGAASYEITATSSAIVLSGSSVILAFGRVILASTSAIALAASSVGLAKGYSLSATSSAITLSGSSAVLQFGRKISATSSAITLAGSSAILAVGSNISAVSSAVTLSGSSVDLVYTPGVFVEEIEQQRRGGAGHQVRFARYWKGKYAGYFNDIEWVEWLLAALSADIAETPLPPEPKKPTSRKIRRKVVEPEVYIEKAYPESIGALLELKLETILVLAEQRQSAKVAKIAQAAAFRKRRREEEDDIAFLLLAA
jgi:hypothetical protein